MTTFWMRLLPLLSRWLRQPRLMCLLRRPGYKARARTRRSRSIPRCLCSFHCRRISALGSEGKSRIRWMWREKMVWTGGSSVGPRTPKKSGNDGNRKKSRSHRIGSVGIAKQSRVGDAEAVETVTERVRERGGLCSLCRTIYPLNYLFAYCSIPS